MRYALTVEYDGTRYAGFQIQKNANTIQAELEKALAIIFKAPVTIVFAGRTDSGVHAWGQVISFSLKEDELSKTKIDSLKIMRSLNGLLPHDIVISAISTVHEDFHPRFLCLGRKYEYLIWNYPSRSTFWDKKALWIRRAIPIDKCNEELKSIIGLHDFTAFTPQIRDYINPERHVYYAKLIALGESSKKNMDKHLISFEICANAFLHNMIRIILGSLLDIVEGRSKYSMREILLSRLRTCAGQTIAATGLYLSQAYYPENLGLVNAASDKSYFPSWEDWQKMNESRT